MARWTSGCQMAAPSGGHVLVASRTRCSTRGGCDTPQAAAGGAATAATLQRRDRHRRRPLRPRGGVEGRGMQRRLRHRAIPVTRRVRCLFPLVTPGLQRRGRFRTTCAGKTLRENPGPKPHVTRHVASRQTARLASEQRPPHGGVRRPASHRARFRAALRAASGSRLRAPRAMAPTNSPCRPSRRAPMQRAPAPSGAVEDASRGSPRSAAPGSGSASSATPSRPG